MISIIEPTLKSQEKATSTIGSTFYGKKDLFNGLANFIYYQKYHYLKYNLVIVTSQQVLSTK